MTDERLLTVGEVAEVLGCSLRTARGLISDGALPSLKIGGLRRVTRTALDSYLAAERCAICGKPAEGRETCVACGDETEGGDGAAE